MSEANETSIEQIVVMLAKCHRTCKGWIKENQQNIEIPIDLKQLGGYENKVQDQFGETYKICDLASGKTTAGVEIFFYFLTI